MFCAYTRPRYQVSVYRTIVPLVIISKRKRQRQTRDNEACTIRKHFDAEHGEIPINVFSYKSSSNRRYLI